MGMVFIGQNIGCARCHDHKYDPIPTTDYYALAGILKSSVTMDENDERGHFMVQRPLANQSKLEAFEKAQEVITLAEKELSDIIVDANDQLRRQRIGNLAQYLLAADQSQGVSENISSNWKQIDPSVLDQTSFGVFLTGYGTQKVQKRRSSWSGTFFRRHFMQRMQIRRQN